MVEKKLRVFEAFAGIGSQSQALENIGANYEVVGVSEWGLQQVLTYCVVHHFDEYNELLASIDLDKVNVEGVIDYIYSLGMSSDTKNPINRSYLERLPKLKLVKFFIANTITKNVGSIVGAELTNIPDHDLFTYSFPCQDISIAGDQKGLSEGSGTRSSLLWECRRIIEYKKPKYLLLENVKNLVGKKHKKDFDNWLSWLESLGYTNYWKVINANTTGTPQKRERVFVVSILGSHNEFKFPDDIELETVMKDILEDDVDSSFNVPEDMMRNWVAKKPPFGDRFSIADVYGSAYTLVAKSGRAVITNNYIPSNLSDYDNIPLTKGKESLIYLLENNIQIRALTPREYWRLTGFPDYKFDRAEIETTLNQLYMEAGNSIVVTVLEGIFRNMLNTQIA